MEHEFTKQIKRILESIFGARQRTFTKKVLCFNMSTSKPNLPQEEQRQGDVANIYAIHVLVEDYLHNKFDTKGNYAEYEARVSQNYYNDKGSCHLEINYRTSAQ